MSEDSNHDEMKQEERVQRKLLDLFFKGLSAMMLPVLIWAYTISVDIAIIKDSISDLNGDLAEIKKSVESNSSSINSNKSKISDFKYIEKSQEKIEKDLSDTQESLVKIYNQLLNFFQTRR
jgi:hypothetical protein